MFFVIVAVISSPVAAQDTPASPTGAPPPPPPAPFAMAGPWSFTGLANIDAMANAAGGMHQAAKGLSKFALAAAYDGSQDDHDGLTGLISAQFTKGGKLSANAVGDVQGADNIDAFGALRLYEAWLSRDYDGAGGWKAGLVDLNVDFDTQEVGSLFINSSDGIGPELGHSGLNGSSIYPTTALAFTGFIRSGLGLTFRIGAFDGTAGSPYHPGAFAIRLSGKDGVLVIAQIEQRSPAACDWQVGRGATPPISTRSIGSMPKATRFAISDLAVPMPVSLRWAPPCRAGAVR